MTIEFWKTLFNLEKKVIVITGAGLIGEAIIEALAKVGATVIFSRLNEQKAKRLVSNLKEKNLIVYYKKMDIADEDSVNNFIHYCLENFDRIDGWINTAYPRTKDWGNKENLTNFTSWKENLNMHLGGYYITSIKAAEIMKKQGSGSIVNYGSIYGVTAPDFSIYEGTEMTVPIAYPSIKGGINMLTKYIATLYGKYNVRANVLAAGGIFDNQPSSFVANYIKKVPLGRMGTPEDLIGPTLFLISDASKYVTGQILLVDGGWTIW
ncbi:MAG: SDR family oxidoreductase [Promethearchaeota archaeon]